MICLSTKFNKNRTNDTEVGQNRQADSCVPLQNSSYKKKGSFGFSLYKCIDAIGAEVIEKIINNTLRTNSID